MREMPTLVSLCAEESRLPRWRGALGTMLRPGRGQSPLVSGFPLVPLLSEYVISSVLLVFASLFPVRA